MKNKYRIGEKLWYIENNDVVIGKVVAIIHNGIDVVYFFDGIEIQRTNVDNFCFTLAGKNARLENQIFKTLKQILAYIKENKLQVVYHRPYYGKLKKKYGE